MPTILRIGPYRFHFYSRENDEPSHIHVERDDLECKFWLEPVALAKNYGFPGTELNKLASLVEENKLILIEAWEDIHG
jgi:chitinase